MCVTTYNLLISLLLPSIVTKLQQYDLYVTRVPFEQTAIHFCYQAFDFYFGTFYLVYYSLLLQQENLTQQFSETILMFCGFLSVPCYDRNNLATNAGLPFVLYDGLQTRVAVCMCRLCKVAFFILSFVCDRPTSVGYNSIQFFFSYRTTYLR